MLSYKNAYESGVTCSACMAVHSQLDTEHCVHLNASFYALCAILLGKLTVQVSLKVERELARQLMSVARK